MYSNLSLRNKLLVAFVFVSLLPLSIMAYLDHRTLDDALNDTARQALHAAAIRTAGNLDDFMRQTVYSTRIESQLRVFARYLTAKVRSRSPLEKEVVSLLFALQSKNESYISAYSLLDANGVILLDTFSPEQGSNLGDTEMYKHIKRTSNTYFSPIHFNHQSDEVNFVFAMPILQEQNLIGILQARYSAGILQFLIGKNQGLAGEKSFPILVDETFVVLADPLVVSHNYRSLFPLEAADLQKWKSLRRIPDRNGEDLSLNFPAFRNLAKIARQNKPYFLTRFDQKSDRIYSAAVRRVLTQNWYVVFLQPLAVLTRPVQTQTQNLALLSVLILLLVFGTAIALAAILSRPIRTLTATAQDIANGDLNKRATVEGRDETGRLALVFNKMTKQLQDSFIHLERKVEKRTAQLKRKQNLLLRTNAEMEKILDSVHEGLFLLTSANGAFVIGEQYSKELETIFETQNLAGREFETLLLNKIQDTELESVKTYLALMFDADMDHEMLVDLNPLSLLEMRFAGRKHLEFHFNVIKTQDVVNSLLVTVKDVTTRTRLELKLKETEKESQEKMELIFSILHANPFLLRNFMIGFYGDLMDIRLLLELIQKEGLTMSRVDGIFRYVHSIKGNAGLLQLGYVVERAHEFEDHIENLRTNILTIKEMSASFLECFAELDGIYRELESVLNHLHSFERALAEGGSNLAEVFLESLQDMGRQLCEESGKEVRFDFAKFASDAVPVTTRRVVTEVLSQLIRNSIVHGLETPEERRESGKETFGLIVLRSEQNGLFLDVFVKDDGRGVQTERLRELAFESGKFSEAELGAMDEEGAADLIFEPGISTAGTANRAAGRGVGMGMVRKKVVEYEIGRAHV